MAVTAIPLTTGSSTTNASSYTTASIAPTPGRLVVADVLTTVGSGAGPAITVTGCGLTWVQVAQTPAAARTLFRFRAMGTPTVGALTIAGGSAMTSALWQVSEFNGADASGTDGSGAIVQTVIARPGSATLVNVPFPAAVDPANSVHAAVGLAVQEVPAVGGAPWAALGTTTQTAPTSGLLGEFAASALQEITASWTTASASFVVGTEIKAAAADTVVGGFGRDFGFSFGVASNVTTPTGAAEGGWSFTGAATGTATYRGAASGTWTFTGAAVGGNAPVGRAAGTWAYTGAAAGTSVRSGTATGSWGFTGSAVGSRTRTGTASGTWGFTGDAVGRTPVVADISHTYGFATLTSATVATAALPPVDIATAAIVGDTTGTATLTSQPGQATLQTK